MERDEQDFLDEAVAYRARTEPEATGAWAATNIVLHLRLAREAKGLTQAQVARQMNLPQSRIAEIERRPWATSFGRILAYAEAIGESVGVLAEVA